VNSREYGRLENCAGTDHYLTFMYRLTAFRCLLLDELPVSRIVLVGDDDPSMKFVVDEYLLAYEQDVSSCQIKEMVSSNSCLQASS
jgi:hypothetical protein